MPIEFGASLASISKICPTCQLEYAKDVDVCPKDGAKLIRAGRSSDDRIGEKITEKLTITGVLGEGGMGTVYKAFQHSMERDVAVKVLRRSLSEDAEVVRRFLVEAKSASKLNHPNIITLFDFGQAAGGELYLMMELLEGSTLSDALTESKRMAPDRTVAIISQVCDAVQYAHDNQLIHRDLKPENVFVSAGAGRMGEFVKVLDFGLAKAASGEGSNITQTGMVCGTPAYMSPEQATGQDLDGRSDVYAIGIMLYELLTGELPFDESTPIHQLMSHVQKTPPSLSEKCSVVQFDPRVEAAVMKCLAKAPADRPSSARELKQMLMSAVDLSPTGRSTGVPITTGRRASAIGAPAPGDSVVVDALPAGLDMLGETGAFDTPASRPRPASTKSVTAVGQPPVGGSSKLLWGAFALTAVVAIVLAWQMTRGDGEIGPETTRMAVVSKAGSPKAGVVAETDGQPKPSKRSRKPGARTSRPAVKAAPVSKPARVKVPLRVQSSHYAHRLRRPITTSFVKPPPEIIPPIALIVAPETAEVWVADALLDGERLIPRPTGEEKVQVKFKLRGYKTDSVEITAESPAEVRVKLKRKRRVGKPTSNIIK
ncbi:MAG: serine/threonine protein kinase [Myxococcota bacterium]